MEKPLLIYHVIRGTILLILFVVVAYIVLMRLLKRAEDPALLAGKWLLTALVFGVMVWVVKPFSNAPTDFTDVIVGLVGGLVLAIIWRASIGAVISKPFTSLYDGGNAEIEPQAYYSIAEGKRKRGNYDEAIAEIRKQLLKFPTDSRGQLLMAEIQAENLNDLRGAEVTIQRLCQQQGHSRRTIALALNSLADWQLKFAVDRDAARQSLEKIVLLFPDTDVALAATQRIAHLASTERLVEAHDRMAVHVPEGVKNIGLMDSSAHLVPEGKSPEVYAEELTAHLAAHPLDTDAREKLALIYADHYHRLDMATDQLEQLIQMPNQSAKTIVHLLNKLADLQVRHGDDLEAAQATLQRIIDLYPNQAAAALAQNRLNTLKLEFKAKEQAQPVKLGHYEHNIGLKYGPPPGYGA